MIVYINKDGVKLNPKSFKRLNGGRNLTISQLNLLGLKKIKIKKRVNNELQTAKKTIKFC